MLVDYVYGVLEVQFLIVDCCFVAGRVDYDYFVCYVVCYFDVLLECCIVD